jgi:hypothetical protein
MLAQLLIRSVIYLTIHEHMLHQKFDRELYDLLALLHKSITFVSTAIFKIYFFLKMMWPLNQYACLLVTGPQG